MASQVRRQAILDAALETFIAEGFAAARLEDIAARGGVAKGTIYLFFKDKQDLFEQVVCGAVEPVFSNMAEIAERTDTTFDVLLATLFELFRKEVLTTRRSEIPRLILAEGRRFPHLAEFYHREVISRGLELMRTIALRAHARGEVASDALVRFPQLVFGPLLISMLWQSTFEPFEKLDIAGLLAAHREMLVSFGLPREPTR